MSQWVQHISKQGKKFKIMPGITSAYEWCVHPDDGIAEPGVYYLPKTEYEPCSAPKTWKDITSEVEISPDERHLFHGVALLSANDFWRFRKVKLFGRTPGYYRTKDAFIIEREVAE